MKNDLIQQNKQTALAKAQQKFATFKKVQKDSENPSGQKLLHNVNARQAALLEQNTAYKELWCTKKPGSISRAKFELTSDKAKATDAVKLNHNNAQGQNHAHDQTSPETEIMKRKLAFGRSWDGCPHCSSYGFIFCNNCDTLCCWERPNDGWHVCPNCGNGARVGKGGITLKIKKDKRAPDSLIGQKQNKALPKSEVKSPKALPCIKRLLLPPRK